MTFCIGRREVITLLGGAAGWPLAARAQQPAMPVIGFLHAGAPEVNANNVRAFRKGLGEAGYVEGRNVSIEFRWAYGDLARYKELAAELVQRQVAIIVTPLGTTAALAAKAATTTIPIVFITGYDPVAAGYVASLARPGGNLTGVTSLTAEAGPKRVELLREVVPAANRIALLVNPAAGAMSEVISANLQAAARKLGLQFQVLNASTVGDFDAVFAALAQLPADGLVIGSDPFFNSQSKQLAALTIRYAVPAVYQYREFAAAGGLMSYAGSLTGMYHQVGVYTGRILAGAKPADLPVQQATKVELFINLNTARALRLEIPPTLLVRADEVIE
jgi:putative ABC transport system substrate-binding protein